MAHCIICGRQAEELVNKAHGWGPGAREGRNCLLCGIYGYIQHAKPRLQALRETMPEAMKVAAFIREHNLTDRTPVFWLMDPLPVRENGLFPATLQQALEAFPARLSQKRERTLLKLYHAQGAYENKLRLRRDLDHPLCFCPNWDSTLEFVGDLEEKEYVRFSGVTPGGLTVRLSLGVWESIEEFLCSPPDQRGRIGFRPRGEPGGC